MFFYVILIIAMMAVIATFLTKGTVALMGKLGGETIYKLHSSSEHIMNTHSVPPEWVAAMNKRYPGLTDTAASGSALPDLGNRAKRRVIRQLDTLITHFERTSIVADEEAREILVTELLKARDEWLPLSWEELIR